MVPLRCPMGEVNHVALLILPKALTPAPPASLYTEEKYFHGAASLPTGEVKDSALSLFVLRPFISKTACQTHGFIRLFVLYNRTGRPSPAGKAVRACEPASIG